MSICDHFRNTDACVSVVPEDVLRCLKRAKDTSRYPQLIVIDVRESRLYQKDHILTAISMSCHTRTMARRAVVSWDMCYADQEGCPAPLPESEYFCTRISEVMGNSILVYNQKGECPFCDEASSCDYFIDALIARGNRVCFMLGGFEAFRQLRSSDFIDHGSPDRTYSETPTTPCSTPPALSGHLLAPLVFAHVQANDNRTSDCTPYMSVKSTVHLLESAVSNSATSEHELNSILEHPLTMSRLQSVDPQKPTDDPDDVLNASVSKILPFLYIGNARDAQDLELLSRLQITHIVNVTNSVPMPFTESARFHYLHIPAVDNNGQNLKPAFESAIQFIQEAQNSNGIILVHCQAGVSRSVAIVMAFIMYMWRNFNVLRALEFVQSRRPVAGPNLHFMGQLQSYHDELHN